MGILILGGGYAGVMAALRLANRGLGAQVTLVNGDAELVERVRNHELAAGTAPRRHSIARLLRGTNVHSVVGRVIALDLERQVARLSDGSELGWQQLVYALGSVASDGGVAGVRQHALLLGDESGARRLREVLAAGARRLVVVGGGLSGVEMATELAERGLNVTLVAAGGVGGFLSTAGQDHLRRALARLNARVIENSVREVRAGEVLLDGGGRLPCDACVWTGGFSAPSLARESGLQVNDAGQIRVDERLRSLSHPNVYAVGDAAEACFDAGSPILMGCKYAMPMAAHCAENLALARSGRNERSFRFGDTGFCVSLGRRDGLIQLSHSDGTPAGILKGRLAALIKELICRYTIWSLRLERRFVFYRWLQPALAAKTEPKRLAA
jgi:NADH dehydrogenase FAD-containing subunit